jgi:hypothetical protein
MLRRLAARKAQNCQNVLVLTQRTNHAGKKQGMKKRKKGYLMPKKSILIVSDNSQKVKHLLSLNRGIHQPLLANENAYLTVIAL